MTEWYETDWPHVGPELKKMEAEKHPRCPFCDQYRETIEAMQRTIDNLTLRLHQAQEHERLSLTRRDGFNTTNVG